MCLMAGLLTKEIKLRQLRKVRGLGQLNLLAISSTNNEQARTQLGNTIIRCVENFRFALVTNVGKLVKDSVNHSS